MHRLAFVAVLAASSFARAETETVYPTTRVAVAMNVPLAGIAGSFYAAPSKHQVIRANISRYGYPANQIPAALLHVETEGIYDGTTTDLGAGWMYFPRRAFDGFMVEAGFLYRNTDGTWFDGFDEGREATSFYAARGVVGWSWLFYDKVFLSLQLGASIGYVRGTETSCDEDCTTDRMPRVTRIGERSIQPEGFLRIGAVFDL